MPAGSNQSSWPSRDDFTFISLMVIVLGGAFLAWQTWVYFHIGISTGVAILTHWQIVLIQHFKPGLLRHLDGIVLHADPSAVTLTQIAAVLNITGQYFCIPAVLLIGMLALLCLLRAASDQFTRNLDLDGLIREQAKTFRTGAAFARRRLRLVPLAAGEVRPADPALHVTEWVDCFARAEDGRLDEARARQHLALQLGPRWSGARNAPDAVRLMFVVFALHLQQRREEAKALLGTFSESLPKGSKREAAGPERPYPLPSSLLAQVDGLLEDEELMSSAGKIASRHAFATPALMSLLTKARRRSGVLAPAQFAGLKLVDRSLWYALHSLGFEGDGPGQTTHPNARVEAAGARDHWAAERVAGRPLSIPMIDRALDAVRTGLVHGASRPVIPEEP